MNPFLLIRLIPIYNQMGSVSIASEAQRSLARAQRGNRAFRLESLFQE